MNSYGEERYQTEKYKIDDVRVNLNRYINWTNHQRKLEIFYLTRNNGGEQSKRNREQYGRNY